MTIQFTTSKNSRITTSKGRERAFTIRARRKARCKVGFWRVGITTDKYLWLDLETPNFNNAKALAELVADKIGEEVLIFPTVKSFWLVSSYKFPDRSSWNYFYTMVSEKFKDVVCVPFCLCCVRYGKATLRISKKHNELPQSPKAIVKPFIMGS